MAVRPSTPEREHAPPAAPRPEATPARASPSADPGFPLTTADRQSSVNVLVQAQGTIGNGAVQRLLQRTAAGTGVQRQPTQAPAQAVWDAPDDFGAISDKGAARVVLQELIKEVNGYLVVETNEVGAQARTMATSLARLKAKLAGEGAFTAEQAAELNAASMLFTGFTNNARTAVLAALKASMRQLSDPPALDAINDAIADAMHALFLKPDDDRLKAIRDVADKVKGVSEKAQWVAEKSLHVMSDIDKARKIFQISEKLESFSGVLGKLIQIKDLGDQLMTLSKGVGGGDSVLGGADQVEATVDLVGLVGEPLMKSVPLFGTYWNDYLVPMTKMCCAALRKVEGIAHDINLTLLDDMISWVRVPGGWHPQMRPPVLTADMYQKLNGREFFEYLYLTRVGTPPPMSKDVEGKILKHKDMLQKASGSEIELEKRTWDPRTWINRRPKDLPAWVAANIRVVWMAFYGKAGLRR